MKLLFVKLLFVFVVLLNSCMSPRVYVPSMPATPLFEKKNDVYVEYNCNVLGMSGGYFGAALTNSIGAYAGLGSHFGENRNEVISPKSNFSTKTVNYTLGLGVFRNRSLSELKRLEGFLEYTGGVFEVSASTKKIVNSRSVYDNAYIDGKYNQWSFNFNYSVKDEIAILCLSMRLGMVHFYDFYKVIDDPIKEVTDRLRNDKLYGIGDFGFNFMLGKRKVKFKCQLLVSYSATKLSMDRSPGINLYNTIGLVYLPR